MAGPLPGSAPVDTDIADYTGEIIVYEGGYDVVGVFGVDTYMRLGLVGDTAIIPGDEDVAAELGRRAAVWNQRRRRSTNRLHLTFLG